MGAKHLIAKPYEHRLPRDHGGRSKIPGWAKHGRYGLVRESSLQVKLLDLLALHRDELLRRADNVCAITGLQLSACRHCFFDIDVVGFQKLGCFDTGGSSLAEVIPGDAFSHLRPP